MDDELIDSDGLSLGRKSVLPGEGFFYPDSLDEQRDDERAERALSGASTAVIADPDADGLACVALLREALGHPVDDLPEDPGERIRERLAGAGDEDDETREDAEDETGEDTDDDEDVDPLLAASDVALVPTGPTGIDEALERVAAYGAEGIDVFVCDLCPDEFETVADELAAILAMAGEVRWFDHHLWDPEVAAAVRDAGVDLVVGESDEECTADVALRSLEYAFPDRFADLAAATRDHDLWIREDPRSDDLADLAYWLDPETYVALVREYGAGLPGPALEYLAVRREEKQGLIDRAVARADRREVGPWDVAVTYGRCSQNEVAEALREQGADATVIVKPAGSASIRGTEGFERCHEVARLVEGGGHPRAAGCKPDIYDDMLDFAHHWTTRGAEAKRAILDAFETVAEDADAEDAEADGEDEENADGG